jgi:2-polyprenyl-6-hydroxyphenyl methylase/3-demethylubiquinone-9 3-methyltransferase
MAWLIAVGTTGLVSARRSMREAADYLDGKSHFPFGKNWASYATLVTPVHVERAILSLQKLIGTSLAGKRFVDIGCGSGVHALAALRLGATEVVAIDIDPDSVATTRKILQSFAPGGPWQVLQQSVFDLADASLGTFDIVYSWGVLHHTGAMYRALRCATELLAPTGQFVFALYRKTHLCWLWKIEKRWYVGVGPRAQSLMRAGYIGLYRVAYTVARRRSFRRYVADYSQRRGMDFAHDVHDWLGGWPYESITPAQTERFMTSLGLYRVRAFTRRHTSVGIFGSGCDQYVYARK